MSPAPQRSDPKLELSKAAAKHRCVVVSGGRAGVAREVVPLGLASVLRARLKGGWRIMISASERATAHELARRVGQGREGLVSTSVRPEDRPNPKAPLLFVTDTMLGLHQQVNPSLSNCAGVILVDPGPEALTIARRVLTRRDDLRLIIVVEPELAGPLAADFDAPVLPWEAEEAEGAEGEEAPPEVDLTSKLNELRQAVPDCVLAAWVSLTPGRTRGLSVAEQITPAAFSKALPGSAQALLEGPRTRQIQEVFRRARGAELLPVTREVVGLADGLILVVIRSEHTAGEALVVASSRASNPGMVLATVRAGMAEVETCAGGIPAKQTREGG